MNVTSLPSPSTFHIHTFASIQFTFQKHEVTFLERNKKQLERVNHPQKVGLDSEVGPTLALRGKDDPMLRSKETRLGITPLSVNR